MGRRAMTELAAAAHAAYRSTLAGGYESALGRVYVITDLGPTDLPGITLPAYGMRFGVPVGPIWDGAL